MSDKPLVAVNQLFTSSLTLGDVKHGKDKARVA
jgi:hypothetical protein